MFVFLIKFPDICLNKNEEPVTYKVTDAQHLLKQTDK